MKRTRRDLTMREAIEAVRWVDLLHRTLGCAGEPTCEADAGGEGCTSCDAGEWLDKLRERGRRWEVSK